MPQLCLAVASLALSTSRPVCVVLLANRLSLVLPYLLCYHTLLSSAVVSNMCLAINTDQPPFRITRVKILRPLCRLNLNKIPLSVLLLNLFRVIFSSLQYSPVEVCAAKICPAKICPVEVGTTE